MYNTLFFNVLENFGEMAEWSKARDWNSRERDERSEGSNPSFSAILNVSHGDTSAKLTCHEGHARYSTRFIICQRN